ncbi:PREDICTED: protein spinster homolog 3 isoform X2 [Chinchilla lanigera]|uniref:protein spinster homolog 3 isoform X2 n=1 Tax=Chinchilla lanigera TaxID=34839 RepID=UPI000698AEE6|nr:PREDICTED: protein spinster homolog 3 isoform X2 [Chinchilla lanigera]
MSALCRNAGQGGAGGHSEALASGQCAPSLVHSPWSLPRWRAYVAAAVLCYINLLNYMNWFIIAGVLLDIQKVFRISDSSAGLLQTVFIGCLLLSAPVFGYLGDRHSRKATLSLGILLWSGAGLSGSFISPQYSWLFFLSRGVVGTGTASYSTIAPTVLADLFVKDQRTRVLAVFYIFIPVGSGLGYVLGSAVTKLTGSWRWALRIMPCLEAVALILLILLVPDPPRGAAEKQGEAAMRPLRSSWCEDVRYLGRNWSFVWSTLGVTAMAFVTGALGFWAPKFLFEARVVHGLQLPCFQEPCSSWDSLIFGALTVVTGIVGVILGAEAARRYKKVNPRAEPLICASSLLATAPCLYLALVLAPTTLVASYTPLRGFLQRPPQTALSSQFLLSSARVWTPSSTRVYGAGCRQGAQKIGTRSRVSLCTAASLAPYVGVSCCFWEAQPQAGVPGAGGAASVLQLGSGGRHSAVCGGAQMPRDSRGASDHSGPHPGRRWQPLPHWTYLQRPSGQAP